MSPRRPWSKSEDEKLIKLIGQFGDQRGRNSKWQEISRNLPGRTNKVGPLLLCIGLACQSIADITIFTRIVGSVGFIL